MLMVTAPDKLKVPPLRAAIVPPFVVVDARTSSPDFTEIVPLFAMGTASKKDPLPVCFDTVPWLLRPFVADSMKASLSNKVEEGPM